MNLNRCIYPNIDETTSENFCLRGKVNTGTRCNYNCYFCYYKHRLNEEHKDINLIKQEIDELYNCGIKEFDLSGGESSLHPDFIKIIKYTKQFGKVTTLSNGSYFKDHNFLLDSFYAGLRGILFSLHGWNEYSHNKIVDNNNGFYDIIHSFSNLNTLRDHVNFEFRINCTITNDFNVIEYCKLIKEYKPDQLNLLPLNYWENANKNKKIDYNIVSNYIKDIIDILKDENIEINVRYIPFCFMQGYEKYVKGIYQHIYDKKDWNILAYENKDFVINKENLFNQAAQNREDSYHKPSNCSSCKYLYLCDGIEYKLKDTILTPIKGEKIQDINYFKEKE